MSLRYLLPLLLLLSVGYASAEETTIAVAANFTPAAQDLADAFAKETKHRAVLAFGSTGKLYAQITQGAPFDVFLSADAAHPELAETSGLAVPGTRFTYARGRLALWSAEPGLVDGEGQGLSSAWEGRLALANPKTAPYGAAAEQVLQNLNLDQRLATQIVYGDSISQAHQFVATGAARMGFVALSQIIADSSGSRWLVPESFHAPLVQDAVLLTSGANNPAARDFLAFLKGPSGRAIIAAHGYEGAP